MNSLMWLRLLLTVILCRSGASWSSKDVDPTKVRGHCLSLAVLLSWSTISFSHIPFFLFLSRQFGGVIFLIFRPMVRHPAAEDLGRPDPLVPRVSQPTVNDPNRVEPKICLTFLYSQGSVHQHHPSNRATQPHLPHPHLPLPHLPNKKDPHRGLLRTGLSKSMEALRINALIYSTGVARVALLSNRSNVGNTRTVLPYKTTVEPCRYRVVVAIEGDI